MANLMDSIDLRTKLVGENRLELLLFHLKGHQLFAINVFKVKEVVSLPPLNILPKSHRHICGVVNIRGTSIPVINLLGAITNFPMEINEHCNLIITEYNRTVQGFLVGQVENIVNITWSDVMPPPQTVGKNHYLTAITKIEKEGQQRLVEIIDVEKVLAEIVTYNVEISEGVLDENIRDSMQGRKILLADDSSTARGQVRDTLAQLGVEVIETCDGLEALELLQSWCEQGKVINEEILMLITDAEMPKMDGYKLTHEIRNDPRMSDLYIALNTSLSGGFNQAMVEKVGCDKFISKFQPDKLVEMVQERLKMVLGTD